MNLVFSSNNKHKIKEIQELIGDKHVIKSLEDISCFEDIPEPHDSVEKNASEKSYYVYNKFGLNCFSDDTCLEIDGLDGAPGVHSARYAGEQRSSFDNMTKVLKEMIAVKNRSARFRTVISLVVGGVEKQFTGILEGEILLNPEGDKGFGYDPIFRPKGFLCSLAEMHPSEKNTISHRGRAVKQLVDYLLLTGTQNSI
jgi:XTP/dITP diphosphohydrolase